MEHFNPKCCNVFNFTPSDGVAPFLRITRGREGEGGREGGERGGREGMAGERGGEGWECEGVGVGGGQWSSSSCRKRGLKRGRE